MMPRHTLGLVWLRSALALAAILVLVPRPAMGASTNLVHNGDFAIGSGDASVDGWRTDAWIQTPGTTDYHWIRPQNGQPGAVELFTHHDNDARWLQPVSLAGGWYYITAEVRTEHVSLFFTGATISTLDNGVMSADLKGDNDWRKLGFYLKVPASGADIDLCLRLGGYMNLTRGRALFRDASIVAIAAPPPGADHVYDLAAIRKAQVAGPIGKPWTMVVTFAVLVLVAAIGWRLLIPVDETTIGTARVELPKKRQARG